jgi:hypothetical protein
MIFQDEQESLLADRTRLISRLLYSRIRVSTFCFDLDSRVRGSDTGADTSRAVSILKNPVKLVNPVKILRNNRC